MENMDRFKLQIEASVGGFVQLSNGQFSSVFHSFGLFGRDTIHLLVRYHFFKIGGSNKPSQVSLIQLHFITIIR